MELEHYYICTTCEWFCGMCAKHKDLLPVNCPIFPDRKTEFGILPIGSDPVIWARKRFLEKVTKARAMKDGGVND